MDASEQPRPCGTGGTPVPPPAWSKGQSGNPGGQPKGVDFRRKLRSFIERPDIWQKLLAKIERDLDSRGPALFALKALAYVYGEPKQTLEIDMRERAERLAAGHGVPADLLIARARELAADAEARTM